MAKDYTELLKDPRWQRKRLKIFERDEFKCRRCNDEFTNLHIHHLYYKNGVARIMVRIMGESWEELEKTELE